MDINRSGTTLTVLVTDNGPGGAVAVPGGRLDGINRHDSANRRVLAVLTYLKV
ncbi:hypothetical protein [Kribbella antibiotica]|uniref:hypothetical protein n=1 Tax=Kribbella antibiotica TaxID=190195 RepID=UPI001404B8C3|nr:hypothetical protein [Kribbella antibiotica]